MGTANKACLLGALPQLNRNSDQKHMQSHASLQFPGIQTQGPHPCYNSSQSLRRNRSHGQRELRVSPSLCFFQPSQSLLPYSPSTVAALRVSLSLCFFQPFQSLLPYSPSTVAASPFTRTPMDTATPPLSGTPQSTAPAFPLPGASTPKLLWESSNSKLL